MELAGLPTVWVPNPVPPMPASSAAIVATATPIAAAMISTMKSAAATMETPSTMVTAAAMMTAAAMTFREGRRRGEQASGECRYEGKFT
jgi:hypothetical protein